MAKADKDKQSDQPKTEAKITERPVCGLVMPISSIDGCNEQHWSEVKTILVDALDSAGFDAPLVSDADDVGIIQKRIIQNLYENPVVVCDVSGKNPNVMFELGLRLAFDKPTIIVKDDKTGYSFDTSPIEHLEYPRDLRFGKIVEFKSALASKVRGTYEKSKGDKNYTTFLKHFGRFSVAKLETTEVSKDEFVLEELRELRHAVSMMRREVLDREEIVHFSSTRRLREAQSAVRRAVTEAKKCLGIESLSQLSQEGRSELVKKAIDNMGKDGPRFFVSMAQCEDAILEALEKESS